MSIKPKSYDVVIVGGGPGGSTVGTLLKKYRPELSVLILERETFPRDHVGESQLPEIGAILNEMGVWEKVEAAGFPIKIGATYRWGSTDELWDFNFIPFDQFRESPRPSTFEGQRKETAFQVDRSIYDKILLDHAKECGVTVLEGVSVRGLQKEGDSIAHVFTSSGEQIDANYFVDASGNAAILRRGLGVAISQETKLQNIAIWDYWQNVEWAKEIGVGGTRIQIMSLGYGWIWFIPLGPNRTSVGLVLPATYYKSTGKKPADIYQEALRSEPRIAQLLEGASSEGKLSSTKDWSYVAERMAGANWFLVGESAGFADPILSAGMTLTHTAAKEAAYSILALIKGEHDPEWLRNRYEEVQTRRVRQHMRFAEFWYASNGRFTDLKAYCSEIAADSGLQLDADKAFFWLGTGGFASEAFGAASLGFFSLEAIKQFAQRTTKTKAQWQIGIQNVFTFNVQGAKRSKASAFQDGMIFVEDAIVRNGVELPLSGLYGLVVQTLHQFSSITEIAKAFKEYFVERPWLPNIDDSIRYAFHTLEAMIAEGWVVGSFDPTKPRLRFETPDDTPWLGGHIPDNPVEARLIA